MVFLVLALLALGVLLAIAWHTPPWNRTRLLAVALVAGGAAGNLLDRVRWSLGVVDFMDVGIGALRWPVFNGADVAVTVGAVILATSFWLEDWREGIGDGVEGSDRGTIPDDGRAPATAPEAAGR